MTTAAIEPAQAGSQIEGAQSGPDAEKGKLFEVPRVAVVVDDSDPSVIRLAFSGSIELERGKAEDAKFYNSLVPGKSKSLQVEVHVAGPKTAHRRDSEGNVDAVVQTKSLVVHSLEGV